MDDLRHIIPLLIPIVGIVMGIGIAMMALLIDYRRKRDVFELHHKERMFALERGIELPPLPEHLLQGGVGPGRANEPLVMLRRGLTWLLVGLAVMVALGLNRSVETAAWGLIPVAVGIANLLSYALSARRQGPAGKPS